MPTVQPLPAGDSRGSDPDAGRVEAELPFTLSLPDGTFDTSPRGDQVLLSTEVEAAASRPVTTVQMATTPWGSDRISESESLPPPPRPLAEALVRRVNRLVRWYRALTGDPAASELALWQLSPIRGFIRLGSGDWTSTTPLFVVPESTPVPALVDERLSEIIRAGAASGEEPPVVDLFLRDAEHSLLRGGFREAVLFAWAVIDSRFTETYVRLVRDRLRDDLAEARDELAGFELSLRTRMTVVLRLLSGRSLFLQGSDEDGWQALRASYRKRNGIIHRGEGAEQHHAEEALRVARWVVTQMDEIDALPPP